MLKFAWTVYCFFSFSMVLPAFAATIYVPGDYGTVQGAINASSNGDTIIVSDGTYDENIDFLGRNVTLRSENGYEDCEIRGTGIQYPTVSFKSGESSAAVLDGFTVTNGKGLAITDYGG